MVEYIEREATLKIVTEMMCDCKVTHKVRAIRRNIKQIPTADVVSREVFEQVKWERDTALQALEEHGIGLGKKADVVEVVRCKNCEHFKAYSHPLKGFYGQCLVRECNIGETDYCSYGRRKEGDEE